jgi:hypothetical protein
VVCALVVEYGLLPGIITGFIEFLPVDTEVQPEPAGFKAGG